MASQHESLGDPFIVMCSVPVATIGVVGSLTLTATPFSLQAYIGVITVPFEEGWTGLRRAQSHPEQA
jgi:multidrug efflux pump subunit AcrB